ncbi:MAG: hypothetical protein R2850_08185 [Bacteroidia bacterium]
MKLKPREGRYDIDEQDILDAIAEEGDRLAMVMCFGGVNYYTGQVSRHAKSPLQPMQLELWPVLIWPMRLKYSCSFMTGMLILQPGVLTSILIPIRGGVSGIYIHEKHASDPGTFRLAGWWGHDKSSCFKMEPQFVPIPTAESWQMSNAPVLSMAAHKASLDIFDEAGIARLREKSIRLIAYLDFHQTNPGEA